MALNLFIHSNFSAEVFQFKIDDLYGRFVESFANDYLISKVQVTDQINREIVQEFGFESVSFLLVKLNNKFSGSNMSEVASFFKKSFGESNVLILFENEKKM